MIETNFFSTYFLPGTLALIMLGMGMSLTIQDFRNIFSEPKAVITGLICQMILLPLIAIGIAQMSGLSPEMQVGLVLISACPGGAVSNLISYLLKGNVALSVSMTSINSFLTILTIPLIVNVALGIFQGQSTSLSMPFWDTVLQVLLITVIPCVLGIFIRQNWAKFALRTERPLKIAMPILLAVAMSAAIFLEKKQGIK
ncbi:MAG: bile acid:sodium symporter family protein, partial [Bacteroidota bacterium]